MIKKIVYKVEERKYYPIEINLHEKGQIDEWVPKRY